MRTRIGTKLIASFVLFVLLIVAVALYSVVVSEKSLKESIGTSSVFLAEEMLRRVDESVYLKIEGLQRYLKRSYLQETVIKSNREFDKLGNIDEGLDCIETAIKIDPTNINLINKRNEIETQFLKLEEIIN